MSSKTVSKSYNISPIYEKKSLEMLEKTEELTEKITQITPKELPLETINTDEDLSESKKLLQKIKESGTAGIISYALWELGFWALSVPVCVFAYYKLVGHFPDFSNKEDLAKLGGEAFAFVNFARFAVPLRIGLALSTTPWIQANVVDKWKKDENKNKE